MSQQPLCQGIGCPRKLSCGHYSEVIHEDDIAFTHSPWDSRKNRCEFYFGLDANALIEHVKNILNGHENNNGNGI
jgi:hypothetical protein